MGGGEFLQGGAVRQRDEPRAIATTNPDGMLVLHREQLGENGRLRMARLALDGTVRWETRLPLAAVEQLWLATDAIVAIGKPPRNEGLHEILTTVRVGDGAVRAYDLTHESMLGTP